MEAREPTVRFGRRSSRGLILGFSSSRVAVLGVSIAVAIAGLVTANGAGFLVSALLWMPLAASAFVRVGGRPVIEWASIAGHFGARTVVGQTEYRASHPLRPRPPGTMALPGDAAALRFHNDEESGAVMIHDPHRHTLTAALEVTHPAFVLLDGDERAQRVGRWGRTYAALAQSPTCAAIQVLEATVPDPGSGLVEWHSDHGTHDGGWADTEYRALLDQARLAGGTHRTVIALAMDMRAAARAIRAAGGGVAGAAKVLRDDMSNLTDLLRQARLHVGAWLSEPVMAAIVRAAYDPGCALDPRTDPGANLRRAGPLAVDEHWDCLRHDSAWSTVLWISEWPRIEVPSDFLHSIVFAPGVRRTLSIVARPLSTDVALRQIRREKTEAVADMAQKQRVGQIGDLSDMQEYEDLLARERSVVAGHTDVEFTGLIKVTAADKDSLVAAAGAITRAAAQSACEVRPLYGRQAQAFVLAALPVARAAF